MSQKDRKGRVYVTTTTVGKWGNSMGVRIPQEFLESIDLALGSKVEVQLISEEQGILLKPVMKRKRKSNRELRQLYLSKRGKNTPEMSQGELIDDSLGDEI